MEALLIETLAQKEKEIAELKRQLAARQAPSAPQPLAAEQLFHYNVLYESLDPSDPVRAQLNPQGDFRGLAILRGMELQKLYDLKRENAKLVERCAQLEKQTGVANCLRERLERMEQMEGILRMHSERFKDVVALQNARRERARCEVDKLYAECIDKFRETFGQNVSEEQIKLMEPIERFTSQMRILIEETFKHQLAAQPPTLK